MKTLRRLFGPLVVSRELSARATEIHPLPAASQQDSTRTLPVTRDRARPQSPDLGIVVLDGVYHLRSASGATLTLLQGGAPLAHLGEGWMFHTLVADFAPVLLFELQHASGTRATWFFDSAGSYIGNSVETLPEFFRKILLLKASVALRTLLAALTGPAPPSHDAADQPFFGLSLDARLQIGHACREAVFAAPIVRAVAELPEIMMALPKGSNSPAAPIHRESTSRALTTNFQERLRAAVIDGQLSWPSPTDGTMLPSSGGLCFNHFAFAYRFEGPATGLVHYVLASEHNARVLGLYFPAEGLIVVEHDGLRGPLAAAFPDLPGMMMSYACRFGDTLLPYIVRGGPKRIAGSMRENHLGHQVWNELSGLDALAAAFSPADLPVIIPLDGTANAFFGPLDAIFPEFAGKTRTELLTELNIVTYANQNDLSLARFTSIFVSDKLRNRIVGHLQERAVFQAVVTQCRDHDGPVVLIGLRVENRTATDLSGFVARLVEHVAQTVPGALIVLDGQNTDDPETGRQATTSFLSHLAAQSPLAAERALCEHVAAAVPPSVRLAVASGASLATSIAWSHSADCVIAFWGAGLAKYRWIGNKPALILSSHKNLSKRGDLSIYSLPRFMADPSPTVFADPACVHDDPDAPQLIPIREPFLVNFTVDESIFFPQVTQFLALHCRVPDPALSA